MINITARQAFEYAAVVDGARWPDAEPIIIKNFGIASAYAKNVIKGRWTAMEDLHMKP